MGNITTKTLSELGTGTSFLSVKISCSFFDPIGLYYPPPFISGLELTGAGKIVLLEYQIGNINAINPSGEDVSPICDIVDSDILFSIKLDNCQINGSSVNWLTGNYSFSIDITSELV